MFSFDCLACLQPKKFAGSRKILNQLLTIFEFSSELKMIDNYPNPVFFPKYAATDNKLESSSCVQN